ncbi:MAG: fatty acid cis/trans isomerase [Oceanospirillaceae bacterium]|nr:fatty acid cis/trans isomerase [Oceanospirillaceae bacterium]
MGLALLLWLSLSSRLLAAPPDYTNDIKPILERRCVVCHSCYDAPCQLKLNAWEGLARGAHRDRIYDVTRLLAAPLTRLEDAEGEAAWRAKGFHPVLPDGQNAGGLMLKLLQLKQQHPLPPGPRLPDSFELSLNRDQQCPAPEDFADYARDYPLWGMPYGLPALPAEEQSLLIRWLEAGAPGQAPTRNIDRYGDAIAGWERFFNQPSNKARLMSRYIYEHLFIASLHFDTVDDGKSERTFFRLVRSETPPGQPVRMIATRRPYDPPGTDRVYYRLIPVQDAGLAKTRMPYALNPQRQQRWQQLFLDTDYRVEHLPGYDPDSAANPFVTFEALPVNSRYRFMLDEAGFTIQGFIKSPVCRGQVALNVINDHFWVFFVDPELLQAEGEAHFLAEQRANLRLPAESTAGLLNWLRYAEHEADYLEAKRRAVKQLARRVPPSLDYLWDGDGDNPNASLTVFRHFDSASVVRGLLGQAPQSAWLIGYPTLERIHYLLVAGFDVYGNVGHQLSSRIYMDFLRMESEFNFLTLLPRDARQAARDDWYRDAGEHVRDYLSHIKGYLFGHKMLYNGDSAIKFSSAEPLPELYGLLRNKFASLQPPGFRLGDSPAPPGVTGSLERLQSMRGADLAIFPEISLIRIDGDEERRWYFTLLHNSAHSNVSELFHEQDRRLPEEDSLLLANGVLGAYPNQFFRVEADRIDNFVDRLTGVDSESAYREVLDRYGIRRTASDFWHYSDLLYLDYQRLRPLEAGVLDYSRLENR